MDHPSTPDVQSLREWHRDYPERRVAGVCAGLARQLDVPLTLVRAGFVVLALLPGLHAAGLGLYLVLWFLMPAEAGAASGLDRVTDLVHSLTSDRSDRRERRDAAYEEHFEG